MEPEHRMLLHAAEFPQPVVAECITKCLNMDKCTDFVLYYNMSTCYWYAKPLKEEVLVESLDINTAWFTKMCLKGKMQLCDYRKQKDSTHTDNLVIQIRLQNITSLLKIK